MKLSKRTKIILIIVVALIAFGQIYKHFFEEKQPEVKQVSVSHPTKNWQDLKTYEERQEFLETAIKNKSFTDARKAEAAMRVLITNEHKNPKTVKFTMSPSVYNGFSNVVEADSAWIYVPFKTTGKNDFGVEKEIAGSVIYVYIPETNTLDLKRWDLGQNN